MQKRFYTLLISHDARGRVRKLNLPGYLVYLLLLAALIGGATVVAGVTSYGHMLLRVAHVTRVETEREELRQENQNLRATVTQTRRWLNSLESLATEVAVTYDLLRLRQTPFGHIESVAAPPAPAYEFRDALARFQFLRRHATAITLYARGVRPLPGQTFTDLTYTPSLWPVRGRLSGGFGQRLDPFNGEGTFHNGVDISTRFGDSVRAAADGFVVAVGPRTDYGRVVVVDHGFGITTWYAHLSRYRAYVGQAIRRGDIIGYVGDSGRSTGPHLHYEVRLHNTPVNPWRFLRS
ncbi:MAG: M23 family metallopeptidase [Terriglobia bacterium]